MSALATMLGAVADLERHAPVDYASRNRLVIMAMGAAVMEGVPVGIGRDPAEPNWPVVYFELPVVGQVAFHLPEHPQPWDGHTKTQARERITEFVLASGHAILHELIGDRLQAPADPTGIDCWERHEGTAERDPEEF